MSINKRPFLGPVLAMVVALVSLVGGGLAVTAPATNAASSTESNRVLGQVLATPGRTVVLRAGTFAHGTTTSTYRIPSRGRAALRLAADARVRDGAGYRAIVRFVRSRQVLTLQRIRHGRIVDLRTKRIHRRVDRAIRIQLRTVGPRVRARAWDPRRAAPGWQIDLVDRAPVTQAGRSRGRVTLGTRADEPVQVAYRLASRKKPTSSPTSPAPDPTPTPTPSPTPSPTGCPRIGIYNDGNADLDTVAQRQFGAMPQLANSYYQPTQAINVANETERIQRGTSPNITITTKGTDTIEALATPTHPRHAEAVAWLDRHIANLSKLAAVDPDVPVYATLEHEYKVKIRLGYLSGRSADPAVYGRALDFFYKRMHARDPRVRTTYWMVGSDRQVEGLVGQQFDTLPKAILFDPYATGSGTQTLTDIARADLDWIKAQSWYQGQEVGLGEFGMQVRFGDDALGRFFVGIRRQLNNLGISWGVFFNRQRDLDTRIVDRTDGKVFPKGVSSFSTSLEQAGSC